MHKIKSKFKHIKKLLKNNTKLKVRFLVGSSSLLLLVIGVTTYFATYSDLILEFNDDPDYVESSVKDNKVIINEVESDYYYYKSLNYTSNDGTLPTTDNKDIYNDNNLVQTKITYKGNDGTNKGYVSLSERQDTYVYFKMFEVNDNNTADKSDDYVLIELIDNPFTDRPGDRGFNGWYTDYQNAKISYDSNYYERYVKVPVTYKDDKPEKIDITMIAKWTTAKVSYVGSNFNTAIRSLNTIGMKKVEKIKITYKEIDMTGYYYQVILSRGESYNGLYDERGNRLGNGTCRPNWWYGETTCTYYQRITNENFDENNTYYYLNNGYMTKLDNSTINREVLSEEVNTDLIDANMSTYYQEVSLNYGESQTGYYNANGEITTGTCNSYYGCTNYKLLQYYNDNGEEEIFDVNKDYYYLVTRDTNILVLNSSISGSWSDNGDYPFTITSLHNGTKYNVTWNANSAINCYNDINIENVTLYYGARINGIYNPPTNNTSGVLFGNYHNVKLGRGLTQNSNYPTLRSVVAGNSSSTGSNNNPTKYKFMLESGIYNSISLSMGASTSSWNDPNLYLNNKSVYGNDYDKVKKNNTALDIYYCASGSWGGNVYANTNSSTNKDISFDLTVKSGTFGSSKYDLSTGIYVGGRYGGTHYSARKAKIEGGYIYNLIGGPLSSDNRSGVNDIYIYMTGGSVDIIIGGAGTTATYGNRIVSVTGGTVNYSVFGGSNGSTGNEGDGTLNGTPYIYIGGTATIGDKNLISNNTTLFGAESGSVFGIGNGRSGYSTIGSSDNSIIIIDDKATINNNVYGGGNYGATGVSSNSNSSYTNIIINDGFIEGSVYGGGNKNGSGSSSKTATVNITMNGGNVVGSIYGGSNEQGTIFGTVNVNVFGGEVTNSVYGGGRGGYTNSSNYGTFVRDDINVVIGDSSLNTTPIINKSVYGGSAYGTVNDSSSGTSVSSSKTKVTVNKGIIVNVFGGGEANASGSEEYDYSFISVTVGINININGEGYDTFTIGGSIFGSGNASSTTGYSYVNIKNYGTKEDIKRNISIQRANIVTLDNSYIELKGATDRTNEYSTVLFSLSRIDELKLINSSSLYLQNGGNLVKKLSSLAMNGTNEVKSEVTLDPETKLLSRNTNNRIYMLEGKNLNIATNENITSFGEVSGMTFFGMYLLSRNGDIVTALYNDYDPSAEVSSGDIYYFTKGSYVLGMHKTNHDITKDGFYTNYGNEEGNGIIIDYIEPTPDNADFYMWSIGEKVDSYEITLTASKYSTLGTYELSLLNHASANTKFSILGFNYATLNEDIKLINYSEIPRVANTEDEANTVFGLNMKSGQNGWITKGSTNFTTEGNNNVNGTIDYQRENSAGAPGLVFYFYHSKNLTTTQSLGSVTISLVAITPIDDLNNEVKRININVNLNTALYNTNDYEGTITPGKKYEMFATSPVDITTKSSFSTYYSLYMESDTTPYKEGYHRSLVSTYLLPVNTELTMIDFHVEDKPVYYYYTVTEEDYNNGLIEYNNYGEVSYPLSKFVKMGSTSPNNNYDDSSANAVYYKDKKTVEEFIFMVDFKDTNIDTDVLDKSLLIELRNNDNQTLISVLGIEQSTMKYDLYHNKDAIIELSGSLSDSTIYRGKSTNLILDTNFIQDKIATDTIFDTNYDEQKLGIKMTILDSRGTPLTSSSLMGVNYTYNGNTYYPRYDGTIRINITEKIANVRSKITINTENSNLSSGEYTLLIESFGSADGIYYGLNSSDQLELKFTVIDNIYGLKVSTTDKMIFINKDTGFTLNNNNSYVYKIEYTSGLSNPNIRLKLLRRDYSTIYTNTYNEVDLKDYVTNTLDTTNNEKEYLLTNNPTKESDHFLYFKDNLLDGTYKLVVSLYDNNTLIGEVYQYIIIK